MTKPLREPLHEALLLDGKIPTAGLGVHLSTQVPFSSMEETLQNIVVHMVFEISYPMLTC